jgi:hypothetical protein
MVAKTALMPWALARSAQHLGGGLAGYASVDQLVAAEVSVQVPEVGDGISEEDDAGESAEGREFGVGFGVAVEVVGVGVVGELAAALRFERGFESLLEQGEVFAELAELLFGDGRDLGGGEGIGEREVGADLVDQAVVGGGVAGVVADGGERGLREAAEGFAGGDEVGHGDGGGFHELRHVGRGGEGCLRGLRGGGQGHNQGESQFHFSSFTSRKVIVPMAIWRRTWSCTGRCQSSSVSQMWRWPGRL